MHHTHLWICVRLRYGRWSKTRQSITRIRKTECGIWYKTLLVTYNCNICPQTSKFGLIALNTKHKWGADGWQISLWHIIVMFALTHLWIDCIEHQIQVRRRWSAEVSNDITVTCNCNICPQNHHTHLWIDTPRYTAKQQSSNVQPGAGGQQK